MEIGYGAISHFYKMQKRYHDSIQYALRGYNINPNSDDFYLCDSIVKSNLFLSYEALIKREYDESIQYIIQSEKFLSRNKVVKEQLKKYEISVQRQIIENRKRKKHLNRQKKISIQINSEFEEYKF